MGQEIIQPSKQLVSSDGGALSRAGGGRLIACPRPLSDDRIELDLPEGLTILEMMELSGIDPRFWKFSHAWLSDPMDWTKDPVPVPHEYWHVVRPKPGITVTLRAAPGKSGGSKGGLGIVLRIVVTVIAAVATWYIGGIGALGANAGLYGALAGAAISIAGNLAIGALIPPPKGPQPPTFDKSRTDSPSYSITGARNQSNPYGAVPRIFGKFRYTPPYAANPYTEIVGNDQYLRLLFTFGYGPLQLEEPKIGETPLADYEDVEINILNGYPDDAPLRIYSNNIHEEPFSVEITNDLIHTIPARLSPISTWLAADDSPRKGKVRSSNPALDGECDNDRHFRPVLLDRATDNPLFPAGYDERHRLGRDAHPRDRSVKRHHRSV